ncbi:MAG: hypothetical protein JOZ72_03260 [Alphaproteobacteria bacterium]|nr:hypothetical protein [Alphaproteobacteria bacterium]
MLKRLGIASLFCLLAAPAFAETTQIVVQWTTDIDLMSVQSMLDDRAVQMGYESDGNDVGSGLVNFYLYAPDATVDGVVRHLIWMEARHMLPQHMRIGVAVYRDAARQDWTYRAAYPAGLTSFDITPRKN